MRYLFSLLFATLFATAALAGENISYSVDGQSYEGYFIKTKPDAPMVLLVHDWDGLTDYEVKRAQMLAELGYSVFAVDLFGAGVRPTKVEDRRQHTGELYKDRQKMRKLLHGALDTAKAQGLNTGNVVAAGYCFGGAAVLELARSGADLKGFVTFHGGLATPEGQDYTDVKGEIIVFHGTADTAISMAEFAALADELEKADADHEMIAYSKALHAFTVFDSADRYNQKADEKSWSRFLAFLEEKLR